MAGNPQVFSKCTSSYRKTPIRGPRSASQQLSPQFLLLGAQRTNPFLLTVSPQGGEGWEDDGVQSGQGQINSERYTLKWIYLFPLFRLCTFPLSHTHICWKVLKSLVNQLSVYVKCDSSSQESYLMDPSVVSKTSHFPSTFPFLLPGSLHCLSTLFMVAVNSLCLPGTQGT